GPRTLEPDGEILIHPCGHTQVVNQVLHRTIGLLPVEGQGDMPVVGVPPTEFAVERTQGPDQVFCDLRGRCDRGEQSHVPMIAGVPSTGNEQRHPDIHAWMSGYRTTGCRWEEDC